MPKKSLIPAYPHCRLTEEEIKRNATLSKRQASSAVSVEAAPSVIKLLEYNAKEINASAAALRVAQSELPRHS